MLRYRKKKPVSSKFLLYFFFLHLMILIVDKTENSVFFCNFSLNWYDYKERRKKVSLLLVATDADGKPKRRTNQDTVWWQTLFHFLGTHINFLLLFRFLAVTVTVYSLQFCAHSVTSAFIHPNLFVPNALKRKIEQLYNFNGAFWVTYETEQVKNKSERKKWILYKIVQENDEW